MPDIRVTDIFRFVDALEEAFGTPLSSAAKAEAAEVVAEDLNRVGVYVEPS